MPEGEVYMRKSEPYAACRAMLWAYFIAGVVVPLLFAAMIRAS